MMTMVPRSNLVCAFAVAASVGMIYDWGEHGDFRELRYPLSISSTYIRTRGMLMSLPELPSR
jgi:hypothetical protein